MKPKNEVGQSVPRWTMLDFACEPLMRIVYALQVLEATSLDLQLRLLRSLRPAMMSSMLSVLRHPLELYQTRLCGDEASPTTDLDDLGPGGPLGSWYTILAEFIALEFRADQQFDML